MTLSLPRRDLLKAGASAFSVLCAAGIPGTSWGEASRLSQLDIDVPGSGKLPKRARIIIPRAVAELNKPRAILVLLHGLGEAHDERLALKAWSELYGLEAACERLMSGKVERSAKLGYISEERLGRINGELARSPAQLPLLVCPVTPKPPRGAARTGFFDDYADWIEQALLPSAARQLGARGVQTHARFGLTGCSMGGFIAKEVFLRKAEAILSFSTVQSAIGRASAVQYAERFKAACAGGAKRSIFVATSTRDPFRAANERFARELSKRGVDSTLDVIPGPHNQPWLREIGTLEMLRFHCRQLSRVNSSTNSVCAGSSSSSDARVGSSKSANSKPGETVQPTRQ